MIARLTFTLCLFMGLSVGTSIAGPAESLRGIRNKKCAESPEAAKQQLFDEMAVTKGLCPKGVTASQTDGWTCKKGGDCKKGFYRCNTQYRCGGDSMPPPPVAAPAVVPTEEAPTEEATPIVEVLPEPAPNHMPTPLETVPLPNP